MLRSTRLFLPLSISALLACSASSTPGTSSHTGAAGGAGGATTASTTTTTSDTGVGGLALPDAGCDHPPDVDGDGDGWTGAEGDCNDCDPRVNPGAVDVAQSADGGVPEVDQDCSGAFDPPEPCDGALALDDTDPRSGARAIELCRFAEANPAQKKDRTWGVLSATYVGASGTPLAPGAQVGLQDGFGPHVHPQGGARLLALSTGRARTPGQPQACGNQTCPNHAGGTPPPGFPQDNPACPASQNIHDDVGLELVIRAPTNATGYRFLFRYYTFEWPEWVCNFYNDQFIALASPAPVGSINGNISFDGMSRPVGVNLAYFDACDPAGKPGYAANCMVDPCPSPPDPYCPLGVADLAGTGFDVWGTGGATRWLESRAPVHGGDVVTLRFAIWDTGDQTVDSTALVDRFMWIAQGPTDVSTGPVEAPK